MSNLAAKNRTLIPIEIEGGNQSPLESTVLSRTSISRNTG